MNSLLLDLKYGFRNLTNRPGFTIIALLILALGIGANTALFSILYSVFWKPYPYHDPERLAIVWETQKADNDFQNVVNPANFYDWKEQNKVFTDMAAFVNTASNLNTDGPPEEISTQYVTSNYFQVLGVNPLIGRAFTQADDQKDDRLVVLSHGLWLRRFGGQPNVIGKTIHLNGRPCTVIGVARPGFQFFLKTGWITTKPPQLWILYTMAPEDRVRRGRYLSVVARMKPGVSAEAANANMTLIGDQLEKRYYEFNAGWGVNVVPLREQLAGELRKPLWILGAAVAFVLLIACSNVANLLLSRALTRRREIAVRAALGAGRGRIVRQLLTESVLLSLIGGASGIMLAYWGVTVLTRLGYRAGIDFGNVEINWIMLTFALGLSLFTGLVFGIAPALAASRTNLNDQLKEGSRGTTGQSGRIRSLLVVTELAVTLVLLTGAALLIQSFWRLSSIDSGFNPKNVLSFRLILPSAKYPDDSHRINWYRTLAGQLRNIPGVKSVGMASFLPFAGPSAGTNFFIVGEPAPLPDREPQTLVFVTDEGYFQTLQIPLKKGRGFTADETVQRRNVVLVNEALAEKYFPGQDPIGKQIIINMRDDNVPSTIIGIVGNVKHESVQSEFEPSVYWPYPELTYAFMNFVIRTEGDPLSLVSAATSNVRKLDPTLPLADVRALQEWVGDSTARARFSMVLLMTLAALALILALAGIYGVLSHTVLQRTQEMGIRMALGASSSNVFTLLLKHSTKLIAAGILTGVAISITLTRLMRSMLYETSTSDPLIFSVVVGFLLLAALLASSIPSRRAAKVDPLTALRYE